MMQTLALITGTLYAFSYGNNPDKNEKKYKHSAESLNENETPPPTKQQMCQMCQIDNKTYPIALTTPDRNRIPTHS